MTVRPMTGGRCRASPVTSQHVSVVGRTSSHHDDQPLPKFNKIAARPPFCHLRVSILYSRSSKSYMLLDSTALGH